jgi:hypothetical protein
VAKPGIVTASTLLRGNDKSIEDPYRHQQGLRRVEAPGHADHSALEGRGLEPPGKGLHLDVVRFPAASASRLGIRRHVGKAANDSPQRYLRIIWVGPQGDWGASSSAA